MVEPAPSPDDGSDVGNSDPKGQAANGPNTQRPSTQRPSAGGPNAERPSADGPAEDEPGVVWFLSGDLMFASRVRAAAVNAGLLFRLAGSLPRESSDRDESPGPGATRGPDTPGGEVRFIVVDLATRASLVTDAVGWAASLSPRPETLAYGPHVQAQRLRDASEAGVDRVMTRGQFDSRLGSLFVKRD